MQGGNGSHRPFFSRSRRRGRLRGVNAGLSAASRRLSERLRAQWDARVDRAATPGPEATPLSDPSSELAVTKARETTVPARPATVASPPKRARDARKMTRRGRLTIAAGIAVLLAPIFWLVAGALPEPPSVASGPPLTAVASIGPALPPAPVMPPVARGALVEGSLASERGAEYTLDPDLTQRVWSVLDKGRVELGHVLVMDPRTGELLAYVSTDPTRFPPDRAYPAASLVKVITAAALMDASPSTAEKPCRYAGNPYRLNRKGVDPPKRGGNEISLRRALSTSNNKCFAQYAVHGIGSDRLIAAIDRFGLLRSAGPAHPAGEVVDPGKDKFELGQLGSGLDGLHITPLHAIQLAGILAHGRRVQPTWLAGNGPAPRAEGERVLTESLTRDLRDMLKDTTKRGTARKAFRTRRGHPLLKGLEVAGKTGSLNGKNPDGRYEWFIGVAPADKPTLAVATVAVQGPLYWMSASQLAAEVLKVSFCPKGVCSSEPPQARRTSSADQPFGG